MRAAANIRRCPVPCLLIALLACIVAVSAQSSTSSTTPLPSFSLSAGNTTITSTSLSSSRTVSFTAVVPTTYNISLSATSTSSSAASASSSAPPSTTLSTKIDPAFGVLGALLILTGLSSAFWGHKNRWTSFFLIGFYTLAIVCLVLILQFGVIKAIHPPSETLRGLYLLSCVVAGGVGGGITIFFWKGTRYFIGGWGGFVFGLFIQCLRTGGLIQPIGYRWIMYIGCAVVGFCLCTIPKIHYYILLVSTSFVGATSLMLGVDCYTTAGLKEFYAWNIGYSSLFPIYTQNHIRFPVNQTMQIELGLMGAISLMGIAVQLRILKLLLRKLHEIEAEQKRREQEDTEASAMQNMDNMAKEKEEWEKRHHGRDQSDFSSLDLIKGRPYSPDTPLPGYPSNENTFVPEHLRHQSKASEATPINPRSQSPGALPALDFGHDIQNDVPRDYLAGDSKTSSKQKLVPIVTVEELQSRESLLTEIQNIRRSIEVLKTDPSSTAPYSRSNRPSVTSRRTLSQDLNNIAQYRANSQSGSHSMDTPAITRDYSGSSMPQVTSTPSDDWDKYVRDRKLFQPPSGVTSPIPASTLPPMRRLSMSSAVLDAVSQRQQREGMLAFADFSRVESDPDLPAAELAQRDIPIPPPIHARANSAGNVPVTILPPKNRSISPAPQRRPESRVATYEELSERHRQKIKELQAPVTEAVNQQANITAAKERWERSIALEREAVTKRQAEKAAALLKDEKGRKSADLDSTTRRRSRTLSADKLAAAGSHSSRRMSMMKVEDWQKHQQDLGEDPSISRRQPRSTNISGHSAVPFPNSGRPQDSRRIPSPSRNPSH